METPPPSIPTQPQSPTTGSIQENKSNNKLLIIFFLIIILILLGVIGFFFMSSQKRSFVITPSPTPFDQESTPSPTDTPTPTGTQTVNLDENIKVAIESKNYSALDIYMAPTLSVVLHASECCGPTDKETAIKQLDYLNEAKAPWNWNQDDPTIIKIKTEYPDTFGKGTVGISQNEMVISYEVKDDKIVGIYLSATYKIMVQ